MATEIQARVLKALAPLATKSKEDGRQATMFLHVVPPEGDDEETMIEVTNGHHFLRAWVPGIADEPVLLHQDDAKRLKGKEVLGLADNRVTSPFRLDLISEVRKQSGEDAELAYPKGMRDVGVKGRAAFAIHPRQAAAVLMAMHKLGVTSVEVILPKGKGSLIGFRGEADSEESGRVRVEGGFLPADMFHDVQAEAAPAETPKP